MAKIVDFKEVRTLEKEGENIPSYFTSCVHLICGYKECSKEEQYQNE